MKIGITERGDAALDLRWLEAVRRKVVDGAIAITKAPQALLSVTLPANVVVHCTITGQGSTVYEPNVAPPATTLVAYETLVQRWGTERIVLRIDPILPMDVQALARAYAVREAARQCVPNGRVRISFLDYYLHVRERFAARSISYVQDFHAPYAIREGIWIAMGRPEVCGEPGFTCQGCVAARDVTAMGLVTQLSGDTSNQRHDCACAAEKVELLPNRTPCKHACLYCYWQDQCRI